MATKFPLRPFLFVEIPEIRKSILASLASAVARLRNCEKLSASSGFIISSAEALPVARLVGNSFEHDPFVTTIWPDGVFKVANYTLQDLEAHIEDSDFAVAIAHADDITDSRGKDWPTPRDNVIFELGLFMGKLGRQRAILMEPREERVKLPSDLSGVTTIPYKYEKGKDVAALMRPACDRLRDHIIDLGPFNG